ncbi:MAG: hypothetical protein U9M97_01390 [Candidatus Hadarchaeota archaeon]|nr:hypothetical protein [Candidatus Hadarchaeota archaeon]
MMRPRGLQPSRLKARLLLVNWFGVAAGVLMLVLPFMGSWWQATVGTEALEFSFSPFNYDASLMDQPLTSHLVGYFMLAAKLVVIIGGVLMLAGSLMPTRWWGKRLVRFGAMKVFWMIVMIIVMLLVGAFFMNKFLPGIISGMAEGEGEVQLNVPYIAGTTTSSIQAENATLTAPVNTSLTVVFWMAVLVAGLGIGARIYHGRLLRKLGPRAEAKPKLEAKEKPKPKPKGMSKTKPQTKK